MGDVLKSLSRIDFQTLELSVGGLLALFLGAFLLVSAVARYYRTRASRRMFRGSAIRQATGRFSDDSDGALEDWLSTRPGFRRGLELAARMLEPTLLSLGALAALQSGDSFQLGGLGIGLAVLLALLALVAVLRAIKLVMRSPNDDAP